MSPEHKREKLCEALAVEIFYRAALWKLQGKRCEHF